MKEIKLLELFAGSRSIGKAAEQIENQLGGGKIHVFSSDVNAFEKIDYVTDILSFDVNLVPFIPDIIWGSPPCTFFSVASIGHHWNKDCTPKSINAIKGVSYVAATLKIINHFKNLNPNLKWFMENPVGKLRKLPVVAGLDRATITYCKYGDDRMKPTDIWTNHLHDPLFNPNGWRPKQRCCPGNSCHHILAPRGSKTGTQGRKGSYERSKIPPQLCQEILMSCISTQ